MSIFKPPISNTQGGLGAPDAPLPPHRALVLPQNLPGLQPDPPAAAPKRFRLRGTLSLVPVPEVALQPVPVSQSSPVPSSPPPPPPTNVVTLA